MTKTEAFSKAVNSFAKYFDGEKVDLLTLDISLETYNIAIVNGAIRNNLEEAEFIATFFDENGMVQKMIFKVDEWN